MHGAMAYLYNGNSAQVQPYHLIELTYCLGMVVFQQLTMMSIDTSPYVKQKEVRNTTIFDGYIMGNE